MKISFSKEIRKGIKESKFCLLNRFIDCIKALNMKLVVIALLLAAAAVVQNVPLGDDVIVETDVGKFKGYLEDIEGKKINAFKGGLKSFQYLLNNKQFKT